jgi:hypothetical protein
MAKFKTRGGKTVVYDSEAIGIDDPLVFGPRGGGKRAIKQERKRKHRDMERMLRNSPGKGSIYDTEAQRKRRPLQYQDSKAQIKRKRKD